MNKNSKRGFALLILGAIGAFGGTMVIVYFRYLGLALGLFGTALVFSDNSTC